jgi:2-amino-4-hydroxy-6-hydroxymethyldihydropteridine diphosphokinase
MSTAVLSIGSNLGDRLAHLRGCLEDLAPWVRTVSGVYETAPWGPVPQDDYLNAVVLVADDTAKPRDWLTRAQDAERRAGRTRAVRWGPRTLDVDVIVVDGTRSTDPELILPHPHAYERAFVLVPWLAADPEADLPGHGGVRDLIRQLDTTGVRHRPDLELA